MIGATVFGYLLDAGRVRRSLRARIAWLALFALSFAVWGGGYAFQRNYTREEVAQEGYEKMDWTSSGFIGPHFLYLFYGFFDAVWQTMVYWQVNTLYPITLLLAISEKKKTRIEDTHPDTHSPSQVSPLTLPLGSWEP